MTLVATTILAAIVGAGIALYIRRMNDPMRRRPTADAQYYRVEFQEREEAAAFMAALSRFLVSPAAAGVVASAAPAEVWTSMQRKGDTLYLNETSFRAATLAFSPLPPVTLVRGNEVPRNTALSLAGFSASPMGMEDASKRMS